MNKSAENAGAVACLASVVEVLKDAGRESPESPEMLLAYQVLVRIKGLANAFDVPLADIGLGDFDPDELLQARKEAS